MGLLLCQGLQSAARRSLVCSRSVQTLMRSEYNLRPFFWSKSKQPDTSSVNVNKRKNKDDKGPIGVNILTVGMEDRERVAASLRRTFFKDEPLLTSVGVAGRVPHAMEDYVLSSLREGISFMASGRSARDVQGLCVNATMRHNEQEEQTLSIEARERMGAPCKQVLDFWKYCEQCSNLFSRFFVSHIWEVRYLATEPGARGRGIAKALTEHSVSLARQMNYPLVTMQCTSYYSYKVAQSVGMTEAWSIPYDRYLNSKGQPVFTPPRPHTHMHVMVLSL